MPSRNRNGGVQDVRATRPSTPYLADGSLNPLEWEIACSAVNVLSFAILYGKPWFVRARPVEIPGHGVELEVAVRWLTAEVWHAIPFSVDGYEVNVVVSGQGRGRPSVH